MMGIKEGGMVKLNEIRVDSSNLAINMSATIGRGAQNIHASYIKPALRKAYHKKSGGSDATKLNHDEAKNKNLHAGSPPENVVWIPDTRTGIYYPKGQEKVIQDVPSHAAKDHTVNWFSMP